MVKFAEAEARIHKNIFVCRRCKTKIRTDNLRVIDKRVKCRKCNGKELRPLRKK